MPQLDPTWFASQLFWLAICFIALYALLSRVVLPPLLATMQQRDEARDSDLSRAQSLKDQAEAARAEYEHTMKESRARVQKLFADAEAEQKERSEKRTSELSSSLARQINDAERRIESKKNELLAAMTPAVTELVGLTVEKLIHKKADPSRLQQAIQQRMKG